MSARSCRGFTLVEVLVALMIVAIGLAGLMTAVSGAARTSGYLRDKTLAQWIALNRLAEVRLTVNKLGQNTDAGELDFANRTWHYDTRYFDTSIASMKRVVVRVWLGSAKTKSNPLAESTSFLGSALGTQGASNTDWRVGSTVLTANPNANGAGVTPNVTPTNPTGATPGAPGTTGAPGNTGAPGTPGAPGTTGSPITGPTYPQ
jgi:general secretion pathway protein I